MMGWMYVVTLLLFVVAKGRWYYMGPAYPMLYAAGAVWGEGWLATMQRGRAMTIRRVVWVALAVGCASHHCLLDAAGAAELALVGDRRTMCREISANKSAGASWCRRWRRFAIR